MTIEQIDLARKSLINAILHVKSKTGAFTIPTLDQFLQDFSDNNVFKTGSSVKEDVELVLFDSRQERNVNLTYSIKSSLGSQQQY